MSIIKLLIPCDSPQAMYSAAAVPLSSANLGDATTADAALEVFEVDEVGLDKVDRSILEAMIIKFGGGPVGLSTLAIAVGEDPETVEDAYEPFLILEGLLQRTPRGRIATERAYQHLGVDFVAGQDQGRLI